MHRNNQGLPVTHLAPRHRQVAVNRRSHVIRVALHIGGDLQHLLTAQTVLLRQQTARRSHTRHNSRRRRTHTARMRNLIISNQLHRRQFFQTSRRETSLHRLQNQVALVARNVRATLTAELKLQAGFNTLNNQLIIEAKTQTHAVIAGTQVSARSGNANLNGRAHRNIRNMQGRHEKNLAIGDVMSE